MSPAANVRFDAVPESVPVADVPLAAIENVTAVFAALRSAAVSAEPVGTVVTATLAAVIVPENGIAIPTRLEVVNTPGMTIVMVDGPRICVVIFPPIWVYSPIIAHYFWFCKRVVSAPMLMGVRASCSFLSCTHAFSGTE